MYEKIYDAWKREQENVELQPLAKDFYVLLAGYVRKIREESRMLDEKTAKAKLIKHELRNARQLIKALIRLRYEKIFRAIISGKTIPADVLTEEEEKFYSETLPSAESFQELLKGLLLGRFSHGEVKKEKPRRMLVRFLKDVQAIIGVDMKTYGPFKIEDVGTVPVENATVFIKQGVAVQVDVK